MMRKASILSILILPLVLMSQEVAPEITLEKMRLLILPSSAEKYQDVAGQVTAIVASQATKLGRFEVIDRNNLEAIMDEQALQLSGIIDDEQVVEIGRIASAPEALLVTVLNFGQKGVPPDDDDDDEEDDDDHGLFGEIVKDVVDAAIDKSLEGVERYPNNIQTTIDCDVRKIDLETGQSLDAFSINASHTGGNTTASLNSALGQVKFRVSHELRQMYLLASQIVDVRGRDVILLLGKNMGLKKGTMFAINKPSAKRLIGEREITIPGRQVAFVKVTDMSGDANRGRVLRRWATIEPGYPAVEATEKIMAGGLGLKYGSGSPDMGLELAGFFNPLGRGGGSLFFGLGTLKDSYGDIDFNLRAGADFYFRLINTIPFSLAGTVSLPLNFAIRSDDENNTVSAVMFNPLVGGRAEIMLGAKMDLVATVGYCPGSHMSKWRYSEEDEDEDETNSYPAVWVDGTGPKFDPTGLYFSLGLRFLIFDTGLPDMPSLGQMSDLW